MKFEIMIFKIKRKFIRAFYDNERYYYLDLVSQTKHVGKNCRIFGKCRVNENTLVGNNVVINSLEVIGSGNCTIGQYCHLARGLTIITSNHNYKGNGIPYDNTVIEKPVIIGDFVWIGANVTILPGVSIGEGAIIQAGSVVRHNIPPLCLAGGNPAEVFANRDEKHYYAMKSEGKYF